MSVKSSDATHYALQKLNRLIENRMEKLRINTTRLKRELWLLQRHVKEFRHPLFENWEADMLTRLIEVAYAFEYRKLPGGVVIGKETVSERENLTRAYSLAARDIRLITIRRLGLSDRYHEALQRYPEVGCRRWFGRTLSSGLTCTRLPPTEVRILSERSSLLPNGSSKRGIPDQNCMGSGPSFSRSAMTAAFSRAPPSSDHLIPSCLVDFPFSFPFRPL